MDAQIVDYLVLDSEYSSKLSEKVKGYINIGWVPFGPVQCSISRVDYSDTKLFAQTLVKYEETKKEKPGLSYPKE